MKNQIIELKCIDMSVDGQGICKHEGLVVFVKGMILDEVAKVKIIAHKKNLAYGIIDELLIPSKYRKESKKYCPKMSPMFGHSLPALWAVVAQHRGC